jgi:fumarate reductase flavoprotein subunit
LAALLDSRGARAPVVEPFDVVVVGGGGAGLAAAISAASRGARVVLVERQDKLGGSTAISIGSFTAADTPWQRRKGISDTTAAFLEDMAIIPGVSPAEDAPALRAVLAAEAAPALSWLSSLGVAFVGPFPEAPHRVPRMHNVVPDSRMYIACLERAARRHGVCIILSAEARDLFISPEGEVIGVDVTVAGRPHRYTAEQGVVLATGDFSGNAEMRRTYLSPAAADSIPANPESTGHGHTMGLRLGGDLRRMAVSTGPKLRFRSHKAGGILAALPLRPWLMKPLAALVQRLPSAVLRPFVKSLLVVHMQPSPQLFESGAILINLRGERFCDETKSTLPLSHEPEAAGYVVFDEAIARKFSAAPHFISTAPGIGYAFMPDYQRARPDLVHRAETAAALASALNMKAETLQTAIASAQKPLGGPLVALGPVVSTLTVTEGGLAVDTSCRVLRPDGTAIAGLFAAGGVAQGGMRLSGHGLHIAWAIVSGRLAGQSASRRMQRSLTAWQTKGQPQSAARS